MGNKIKIGFVSTYPPTVSGLSRYADELSDYLNSYYDDMRVEKISVLKNKWYKEIDSVCISDYDIIVYNIGNHPMNQKTFDYALRYPSIVVLHEYDISSLKVKSFLSKMIKSNPLERLINAGNCFIVHSKLAKDKLSSLRAMTFKVNEFYFSRKNTSMEKRKNSIGIFGFISKSKGANEILESFKKYKKNGGSVNIFFAGDTADFSLKDELIKRNLDSDIVFYKNPSDGEFDSLMESCIGAINLRTRESGETSANMLKLFSLGKCVAMNSQPSIDSQLKDCYYSIDSDSYVSSLMKFFYAIEKNEKVISRIAENALKAVKNAYSIEKVTVEWHEIFKQGRKIKKYSAKIKVNKVRELGNWILSFIGRLK